MTLSPKNDPQMWDDVPTEELEAKARDRFVHLRIPLDDGGVRVTYDPNDPLGIFLTTLDRWGRSACRERGNVLPAVARLSPSTARDLARILNAFADARDPR